MNASVTDWCDVASAIFSSNVAYKPVAETAGRGECPGISLFYIMFPPPSIFKCYCVINIIKLRALDY